MFDIKKVNWKHVFILLLIFLVAFSFRTHILRYDYMFGFDGYWHARLNADMIKNNAIPKYDFVGTYHNAYKSPISISHGPIFWSFGYVIYKIFSLGQGYNEDLWIWIVRWLPALYGALTALAVYLIFRWAYNSKKIGYIAGFITAVLPGYVYRTMGGFYEEDSMGFMWMAFGIAFLIKALKEPSFTKEKIIYAALSGLMFGIMSFIWDVFVIVPVIIEAYFVLTFLWMLYQKADKQKLKAFAGLFAIAFVVMLLFASFSQGTKWIDYQVKYAKGFLGMEGGATVNNAGSGIGEESTGHQVFGKKYGVFNIFFLLGIIAFIYSLYRKKYNYSAFMFLVWGLLTFYLAWNKLKATYWYGLGLAVLAGFAIAETFMYFAENKSDVSTKVFAVVLGILLLSGGVASGVIFVHNHSPSIDGSWKSTIEFMRDKLPENAKMFNWWNWGHWITFIGHKRASTDNTNSDQQANRDFAMFVIDNNLQESLGIIKAYDADYVVLSAEDIANQYVYVIYAYKTNASDYRLRTRFGRVFDCQKQTNPLNNQNIYNCGGNKFTEQQMSGFAINWQSKPNEIYQGKMPIFYYTNKQKNKFFMLNNTNNESTAAKLWFNNPETLKYFELVFDNGSQKIWKVKKEAFKDIEPFMVGKTKEEIEEWNSKLFWLK